MAKMGAVGFHSKNQGFIITVARCRDAIVVLHDRPEHETGTHAQLGGSIALSLSFPLTRASVSRHWKVPLWIVKVRGISAGGAMSRGAGWGLGSPSCR